MGADIIGADNTLPQCLRLRYFVEGQGYALEELKYHQDNTSDVLMKTNGKE